MTRDAAARDAAFFATWLTRWDLTLDGPPFKSLSGHLLPVRQAGAAAILKISHSAEEIRGGALMEWWGGDGAARVLAREGDALLLERATGARSLTEMARGGEDDEATRILCAAGDRLHAARPAPPPSTLVPLETWFRQLWPTAEAHGGLYAKSAAAARALLAEPQAVSVVHGDLHHGNVLDFGPRGWLAIDPKGLLGERSYDYPHIIMNPDVETATAPGRLARRVAIISEAARIDPRRLLQWTLAYAGLSASWTLGDGDDPWRALAIGEIAAAELGV
ncbi:MAG TPA: aminoglycoside phosphotransferase family protein [Caulobacteraceae bacterium]|nr:aminoglycoside phosphotransferase family protein [Caulobacteraceae bacterium]